MFDQDDQAFHRYYASYLQHCCSQTEQHPTKILHVLAMRIVNVPGQLNDTEEDMPCICIAAMQQILILGICVF